MKRKLLLSLAIAFVAVIGFSATAETPVSADGGPHGGYQDTSGGLTDRCAACHRVHQGKSNGRLLKADTHYALCISCHNGVGSVLNVIDGVRLGTKQPAPATSGDPTLKIVDVAGVMSVSTALYVETAPGTNATYSIRIRNLSAGSITPTLSCPVGECGTLTNPGAIAAGGTGYGTAVKAASGTAGTTLSTTITVTSGASTAGLAASVKAVTGAASGVDAVVGDLNGGGFTYFKGEATTSKHNANPADNSLKPWGFGGDGVRTYLTATTVTNNTAGNAVDLGSALQCTGCHNPHGSNNYRLLHARINATAGSPVYVKIRAWYDDDGAGAGAATFVKDEGCPGLGNVGEPCASGASRPTNKYIQEYYASSADADANNTATTTGWGVATFCGACHTAYPSEGAAIALTGPTSFGGPNVVHYRHETEMSFTEWQTSASTRYGITTTNPESAPLTNFPALRLASNGSLTNEVVTCLTCHRVHGTNSNMTGYALQQNLAGLADNDLSPAQSATSKSMLLYTDNRGMCEACHQW